MQTRIMNGAVESQRISSSVQKDGTVNLVFRGSWRYQDELPSADAVIADLRNPPRLVLQGKKIAVWDSGLITFLLEITRKIPRNSWHQK